MSFDKSAVGFLTDVLYLKGIICWDEYEDIMECKTFIDLDNIIEKMIRGEYNLYKRGEGYVRTRTEHSTGE